MILEVLLDKKGIVPKNYYSLTSKTFIRILVIKHKFKGRVSKQVWNNKYTIRTGDPMLFNTLVHIGRL